MKAIAKKQNKKGKLIHYTGILNCSAILLSLYTSEVKCSPYLVCKDQEHSHPVWESVECPDGNELPNPTKSTQTQYEHITSLYNCI